MSESEYKVATYFETAEVDIVWDDSALAVDGSNILYGVLTINGYPMYLEAFEVHFVDSDDTGSPPCIEAVHSQWDDELEFLCIKCDGPPATFEFMGRQFVAIATPHGD